MILRKDPLDILTAQVSVMRAFFTIDGIAWHRNIECNSQLFTRPSRAVALEPGKFNLK